MYVQAGEIDKAIYIYNRMEAQNAVNAADASNYAEIRARLYLMTGQTNKALNELRRLCNRFPEVNEFRLKYAGTLLDSEKYDEAYEQLQLIARTDSTSGLYHFAMASYYLGTNEKEAAINEMIKVAADKDVAPEQKLPIILRFIGTDTDEEDAPKKSIISCLKRYLPAIPLRWMHAFSMPSSWKCRVILSMPWRFADLSRSLLLKKNGHGNSCWEELLPARTIPKSIAYPNKRDNICRVCRYFTSTMPFPII